MITKEVEITWQGQPAKVVLKKLTWGEFNSVLRESMSKLRLSSIESGVIEIDIITFREVLLLRSIVSAPFPVSIEAIRNLEGEDGEKLFAVANELNPFFQFTGGGVREPANAGNNPS